jgi:hypothetical protein
MIAVLDACVLYPAALRDLLMWLAVVKAYDPRWTAEIHAEWMRSVLANRPDVTVAQLERTRRRMDHVDPQSGVSQYEGHVTGLTLPDENDHHVLAAAVGAATSVIAALALPDFVLPDLTANSTLARPVRLIPERRGRSVRRTD